MKLVIIHNHFRPGGVRRIIELAVPHILRAAAGEITSVMLAGGEGPDRSWRNSLVQALRGTRVEFFVEPAFGYFSEQRRVPAALRRRVQLALRQILGDPAANLVVWHHNPGLARNLILTTALARACATREIPLLAPQHDWWFDNRWQRWPEARRAGFRSLDAIAEAVFGSPHVHHGTVNRTDAAVLQRHLGKRVAWLPNLIERFPPPAPAQVRFARKWLHHRIGHHAPVWLLPCRFLRRKNVAEALLLTRWLRPNAWLVTTGGVSSADEQTYFARLNAAARAQHWPLQLAVLSGDESRKPGVPELLAASEAVLLTSIQEGFGLPYLEAVAARRPLIARSLPNIAPDLAQFGFRFPQCYCEILVHTDLLDWEAERARQSRLFRAWRSRLPQVIRNLTYAPAVLTARQKPEAIPFSRLTLTAQLEVLRESPDRSWRMCAPLNPLLRVWRRRAVGGQLQVTRWPREAGRHLSGRAYAERFLRILRLRPSGRDDKQAAFRAQNDFIEKKLAAANQYPLLWHIAP